MKSEIRYLWIIFTYTKQSVCIKTEMVAYVKQLNGRTGNQKLILVILHTNFKRQEMPGSFQSKLVNEVFHWTFPSN